MVGVEGAGGRDGVSEARCCVFDGVLDLARPDDDDDDDDGCGDHDDDDVEHLGWAASPAHTAIVLPTHTGKRGALRRLFQYLYVCVFNDIPKHLHLSHNYQIKESLFCCAILSTFANRDIFSTSLTCCSQKLLLRQCQTAVLCSVSSLSLQSALSSLSF